MATHDYDIANQSGAAFRTDLNNALKAIQTNNSNSSSPSSTEAYQWWADTTSGTLKIRNSANNAWIELLQLDGTLTLEDGSQTAPALAFRDDLNTGIFSSAADTFDITTGGVEKISISTGGMSINDTGADFDVRIEGDTEQNLVYINAGLERVGIKTSSPDALLHLKDTVSPARVHVECTAANSFPGLRFTNDARSYDLQIDGSTDALRIFDVTAASERLRVNSSGRLLINKTTDRDQYFQGSLTGNLQVEGTDNATRLTQFIHNTNAASQHILIIGKSRGTSVGSYTAVQDNDFLGSLSFQGADGDAMVEGGRVESQVTGTVGDQTMPAALIFSTNNGSSAIAERMRLDKDGNLCIGETGEPAAGSDGIRFEASGQTKLSTTGTGERNIFEFKNANGNVGKIVTQNSNTTFSTSSDYRLKENVVAISDGITRLKQLKPSRFNFIVKKDLTQDGFLAHEVQSVVPEAISGEKDAVKEDGSIDPQGIDYGRLVPLLVAAVQELIGKVEALEAA